MNSGQVSVLLVISLLLSPVAGRENIAASMVATSWLLQTETSVSERWGANPPTPSERPKTNWLSHFDGIAPIEVPSVGIANIPDGLDACPVNDYCVLQLDQLLLEDTLYLQRSKTRLLGKAGNRIRYAGENGTGGAFIEVGNNAQEIVIEALNLDGESIEYGDKNVFGILVYGQGQNRIAILNNKIFDLDSDADAHAIAIYGTGATELNATRNILIRGNQIRDLRTGSSESIAINGNVSNWEVIANLIERVNNIAIGVIGGEATSATRTSSGRVLPGLLDAARNGFVENNTITDMTTLGNSAYGGVHSWAGAIYIDGGHTLTVRNNVVRNSEWAYDIGAENCLAAHDVLLENNTAIGSYYGDLLLGGYARGGFRENPGIGCDPLNTLDDDEGHGYVENITVKNNFLNTIMPVDDQGSPKLQFRIHQSIIMQLPVVADHPDGFVNGDQNSIRVSE